MKRATAGAWLCALLSASIAFAQPRPHRANGPRPGPALPVQPLPPLAQPAPFAFPPAPVDANAGQAPPPGNAPGGSAPLANNWRGAVRVLRVPGAGETGPAENQEAQQIFPEADRVYMQVIGTKDEAIEAARRGARKWICSSGCQLDSQQGEVADAAGDSILQSIKLQTPVSPLPLTIWAPEIDLQTGVAGKLFFDPRLMTPRDYHDRCAYQPIGDGAHQTPRAKLGDKVLSCWSEHKMQAPSGVLPAPDTASLTLGLVWPKASELARFQYLAVTDTCGNALVYPFQRSVSVPVFLVPSDTCPPPDGRVLRVFPSGGWVRVTGFSLDAPAAGNVASVTFRVTVPPLEDAANAEPPPLLFPDLRPDQLTVDCGPAPAATVPSPEPGPPPGHGPPGKKKPVMADIGAHVAPGRGRGQPLAHQSLVIAPEPIKNGNCRLTYHSPMATRLIAPLALRVVITRTDAIGPNESKLFVKDWFITPTDRVLRIPGLATDGESRLLLEVYSNPGSPLGHVVLLSDAARLQPRKGQAVPSEADLRRLIGSVTIHTAPLCGERNFQTAEQAGRCLRGYFTVPAMLATLQVTRAPWIERPLLTRSVLSAVGIAFAVDSYDPVARKAFPIAFQVGGFVEDMGDSRLGFTSYLGIAPTLPILGSGGNTTNIGLLGGLGMSYITRNNGPDEGFKPTAFLSIIVQVGQVNPALAGSGGAAASGGAYFGPGGTPAGPPY